jgi:ribosomal protein S18 acetylase RimI-like enzyme
MPVITLADTDAARRCAAQLLAAHVSGATLEDVPPVRADGSIAPIVLRATDAAGATVGMALTRRAPMAVAYFAALEQGMERVDYEHELDLVSQLDPVAVAPDRRGEGIGTALLDELEARLAARGTRIWFGAIARGDDSVARARFAEARGFLVLQSGQRLPGFLGRRWTLPHGTEPLHWFYKRIAPSAS